MIKRKIILVGLIIFVIAGFWFTSRYPDLDDKAMMMGAPITEDVLSFRAKLEIRESYPTWKKIIFSTANWSYEHRNGMTFGVILAILILTLFELPSSKKTSKNLFLNALKGTVLGAPMGVCVNCAAPIAKGMLKAKSPIETSLATMFGSPTLNVVVLSTTFGLFPFSAALFKLGLTLFFILVLVPLLIRFTFRKEYAAHQCIIEEGSPDCSFETKETWGIALFETAKSLFKSGWYIIKTTVPLMLLAGFLGVLLATFVPLDKLFYWDVSFFTMLAVSIIGTVLPVPIAFDVAIVNAMMMAGLKREFVMILLFTLGLYSIYPFFILWTTLSKRVAITLLAVIVLLGVGAGYLTHFYQEYKIQKALIAFEEFRLSGQTQTLEADVQLRPKKVDAPQIGQELYYEKNNFTVFKQAYKRRPRDASEKIFTKIEGHELGFKNNEMSLFDFKQPAVLGRGLAAGDFNNDGWIDVAIPSGEGVTLYKNLGTKYFQPIPVLDLKEERPDVQLAAFVDINNDGWKDIYLGTQGEKDYFILNDQKEFMRAEIIKHAHEGTAWTKAAAFYDLDRDGDLDFVNTNQLVKNNDLNFKASPINRFGGILTFSALFADFNNDDRPDLMMGNDYNLPDNFYLGNERSDFDQIFAGGIIPITTFATMSMNVGDFNNDLISDIYIAGRSGTYRFNQEVNENVSITEMIQRIVSPAAHFDETYCEQIENKEAYEVCREMLVKRRANIQNNIEACHKLSSKEEMETCLEDLVYTMRAVTPEYDGRLAALRNLPQFTDHKAIEQKFFGNILLQGSSSGQFEDVSDQLGVSDAGWCWNAKFADLDNDEWQDIYVINGWWREQINYSNVFFHNQEGRGFKARQEEFGLENYLKESSSIYIDIDHDGDLDIISLAYHGFISVFINNENINNLITFEFRDDQGNYFGIGTKIYIYYGEDGKQHQVRQVNSGGGFQSYDPSLAHFGLGEYNKVKKLKIIWSTGEQTVIEKDFIANNKYIIERK